MKSLLSFDFEAYQCIKPLILLHAASLIMDSSIKLALVKGLRSISAKELAMHNLSGIHPNDYSEFSLLASKELVEYLFDL